MSNIKQTLDHILKGDQLFLLAGPCVVENESICMEIAGHLKEVTDELGIPYVFKASYRKANRTSAGSFTGIGDQKALEILQKVKTAYDVPIVTDIHESKEAALVAEVADIIQIPAFLFRQTELLEAAGKTGRIVNIKKGQFSAADAMKYAAEKVKLTGNDRVLLTERGNMFGYGDMIVDFRNLVWMRDLGYPVVMDCTHALQQPNTGSGVTGGLPELIKPIARAAVAVGVNGLFMETHPNPAKALSDGANMINLADMKGLLKNLKEIHDLVLRQ
ncbi:3-deoxy-8-phosphooctulonate synthase [bacterium]|nr:3-deoxy-8-phosphooctulonate synthase [bacterium]